MNINLCIPNFVGFMLWPDDLDAISVNVNISCGAVAYHIIGVLL
jgi:hypothetical protein